VGIDVFHLGVRGLDGDSESINALVSGNFDLESTAISVSLNPAVYCEDVSVRHLGSRRKSRRSSTAWK
jgi:hypothetical protein